jgi:molybdenum cofactor biosynthesis enzyme MoaA
MANEIKIPGIRFIVTSTCNYNCVYCHNEWEKKERPVTGTEEELIDSLIKSTKILGGEEVDLTGGEPLLEIERVKKVLKSAKKYELWTNMTTNGYYLGDNLNDLKQWGLNEVHIHIPSLKENLYHTIMRGNSNLNRVLEGVKGIVRNLDKVMINIPIERGMNEDEMVNFIKYFNGLGAVPRFIESMSTEKHVSLNQQTIEEMVGDTLGQPKKVGEYLWGISKYNVGDYNFETLRCICFDRKCDVCPQTNFIHVDKDYRIRPCNLRKFKIDGITPSSALESLINAYNYLRAQTDVPEKYQEIWKKRFNN